MRDEHSTTICASCSSESYAFASFCISCGEPLDDWAGAGFSSDASTPGSRSEHRNSHPPLAARTSHLSASQRLWRWETLVGAVLLVVTLGYALVTWQRDVQQTAAYRAGVAAVKSHEWDKALEQFGRAGDHREAASKQEEVRRKIDEREQLYAASELARFREDWNTAIWALERLQTIQPSYLDSHLRLTQAREAAFDRGLEDLIYLVESGPRPGLYLRDRAGGSLYLPGSDERSLLRAASADGNSLVYDRPPHEGEAARAVVLLKRLGEARNTFTTRDLPGLDAEGKGIFARDGLWWYVSPLGSRVLGSEVYYYALSEGAAEVVKLSDLSRGKRVVALDPVYSRVVIAQPDRRHPEKTELYAARAAGNRTRLLHTVRGEVLSASVSPDGVWLLHTTQENGSTSITRTVWALPLYPFSHPRDIGAEALDTLTWGGLDMNARLNPSFIPSTYGKSEVIISRVVEYTESVKIFDLDMRETTMSWNRRSQSAYLRDTSALSHDGRYLASRRQRDGSAVLSTVAIDRSPRTWSRQPLPAFPGQIVRVQFSPQGDYLLASVQNPDGINRGNLQALYAAPLDARGQLETPRLVAQAAFPYTRETPALALPGDGSLLAYIGPARQLHAVAFDGTGHQLVAENVRAIWSLKERRDMPWVR